MAQTPQFIFLVLHLQKNRIQNLPSELGCLRLLELLVLNENNLTSLPDSLGMLKHISLDNEI